MGGGDDAGEFVGTVGFGILCACNWRCWILSTSRKAMERKVALRIPSASVRIVVSLLSIEIFRIRER